MRFTEENRDDSIETDFDFGSRGRWHGAYTVEIQTNKPLLKLYSADAMDIRNLFASWLSEAIQPIVFSIQQTQFACAIFFLFDTSVCISLQ